MIGQALLEQIVDTASVARLAQIDGGGRAQALPFVFARVGTNLWSPVDGKPKKHARLGRLAWIEQNPEVCVLIDEYVADWSRLWWLKLFGRASVVRGTGEEWPVACAALAAKYPQYETTPMFAGDPTMVRIVVERWTSWAAAGDAGFERWLALRRDERA